MSASTEFTDPRLIAIYDVVNPIDDKADFFIDLANKLQAQRIIDLGCGTGLLSNKLVQAGRTVTGIEPARGMIDKAKQKYGHTVTWIIGGYEELPSTMLADMTIMTGHVAQFFLDDTEWNKALRAIHEATVPGGHLVFESRNPHIKPFTTWPDSSHHELLSSTPLGPVEWWSENLTYENRYASYELHYLFAKTQEEVVSANTLRFRTYDELQSSLGDAGFSIKQAYGNWRKDPFTPQSNEIILIAQAR